MKIFTAFPKCPLMIMVVLRSTCIHATHKRYVLGGVSTFMHNHIVWHRISREIQLQAHDPSQGQTEECFFFGKSGRIFYYAKYVGEHISPESFFCVRTNVEVIKFGSLFMLKDVVWLEPEFSLEKANSRENYRNFNHWSCKSRWINSDKSLTKIWTRFYSDHSNINNWSINPIT